MQPQGLPSENISKSRHPQLRHSGLLGVGKRVCGHCINSEGEGRRPGRYVLWGEVGMEGRKLLGMFVSWFTLICVTYLIRVPNCEYGRKG
jgi:hypothetical protein